MRCALSGSNELCARMQAAQGNDEWQHVLQSHILAAQKRKGVLSESRFKVLACIKIKLAVDVLRFVYSGWLGAAQGRDELHGRLI